MDFSNILGHLLPGIAFGGQLALIAIGYTMVYGILRLINFAHSDVFVVAGLIVVYIQTALPWYLSLPLAVILTVALVFCIEKVAYKPLRSSPRMSVMISAIGVSYLIQNVVYYWIGGLPQHYDGISFFTDEVSILGASAKHVVFLTPLLVVLLVTGLVILINKTKIGMAMRASSVDFETARLMGIRINSVISVTFIIGAVLAAIGAFFFVNAYGSISSTSGAMPGLKAFVAAVFGGIGSIPGAVVGAFVIGICESIIKAIPPIAEFSDAFTFALLILILVIKPTGLFGEKQYDKV